MTDILDIACDEAGFTGSGLLAKGQRYFAFASVAVSDAEAAGMIAKVRADHSITMPELKASKLLGSSRGRKAVAALMQACEGRYILSVHDKLMALWPTCSNSSTSRSLSTARGCSIRRTCIGSSRRSPICG